MFQEPVPQTKAQTPEVDYSTLDIVKATQVQLYTKLLKIIISSWGFSILIFYDYFPFRMEL